MEQEKALAQFVSETREKLGLSASGLERPGVISGLYYSTKISSWIKNEPS